MPTLVECPSCAERVRVPDSLLGRRVRCLRCGHEFTTAGPEGTTPPAPPAAPETAFTPEPAPPRARREAPDEWEDEDAPRRHHGATPNGFALTSLILGICSLPLSFCCGLFSVPVSVLAIIFGVVGARTPEGRTMGTVGLVLGSVALVLMIALFALGLAFNLAHIR
jgi:predicted Zn finger-like uncharacterized protein